MNLLRKVEQNHENIKQNGECHSQNWRDTSPKYKWEALSLAQRSSFSYRDHVRPHTSLSCTFSNSSGHESCRISGSLSVTTQSDGTSQLDRPSSPIIVTVGNWRASDVTMHRWAERSASVCKSSLPYKTKSIKYKNAALIKLPMSLIPHSTD